MQEAKFARACQDQHAGRPAPSLGWPGGKKLIGATKVTGLGARAPRGLGSKVRGGASRGLGPGPPGHQSCQKQDIHKSLWLGFKVSYD